MDCYSSVAPEEQNEKTRRAVTLELQRPSESRLDHLYHSFAKLRTIDLNKSRCNRANSKNHFIAGATAKRFGRRQDTPPVLLSAPATGVTCLLLMHYAQLRSECRARFLSAKVYWNISVLIDKCGASKRNDAKKCEILAPGRLLLVARLALGTTNSRRTSLMYRCRFIPCLFHLRKVRSDARVTPMYLAELLPLLRG